MAGSALTGFTRLGLWSRTIQVVSTAALVTVSAYYANVFVELM